GNFVPVHLLRRNERHAIQSVRALNLLIHTVQARERFLFVVRELDTRNAQCETMSDAGQRSKRRKIFSRKLTRVHLPEVVVREERFVSTGCRISAWFNS